MKLPLKKGFTFIEILVVVTIIVLLTSIAAVSYAQFTKQSRDAKRKADLEQLRATFEIYKSTNNLYPTFSDGGRSEIASSLPLTGYISQIPGDPKYNTGCPGYLYSVASDFKTYTIFTTMENTTSNEATSIKPAPAVSEFGTVGNGGASFTITSGLCAGNTYTYWLNNP